MLKSLDIKNFTVFAKATFQFSPQLNVVVGENGSGKSHLLKLPYSILAVCADEAKKPNSARPTKSLLETRLAAKLIGVLRPEELGRLARRQKGVARCQVKATIKERGLMEHLSDEDLDLAFSFSTKAKSEVTVEHLPTAWADFVPAFLPTRELLTIYPNFVAVYDNHYLEFEETWRDTCSLLGALLVRGPKEERVKKLLAPIEDAMGGKVELDKNGRFYLNIKGEGRMEMPLVAEGLRKLGMLARLIATEALLTKGYLFWDEPETNLNPRLIKEVARTILNLCKNEIQVFIATHSLFLMRELDVLLRTSEFKGVKSRFFGLHHDGGGTKVEQGDSVDDIGAIASLDEELTQSDRYMAVEG